ncbi:multi-sensor signal transduction histidine kinase [Desulfuromonas soudanensis]|uniref:histidine kinase n=1 Tax=Desulfuromonas soudanensis TaxID=1603606 RepID=A0A0M5IP99_9BACT|nr:ATP-binding protein [Desulfuromonas soudanensis]ALC17948.1 multi-sensor signal transduction histidine kinase [Desulfuromonas soudanensis]
MNLGETRINSAAGPEVLDEMFRMVFAGATSAKIILDPGMKIVAASDEFSKLIGRPPASLPGSEAWLEMFPAGVRAKIVSLHGFCQEEGALLSGREEIPLIREGEAPRTLMVSARSIPSLACSVISFVDITDRKKTETELESARGEQERKHTELRDVFSQVVKAKQEWEESMDRIADLVILIDETGRIRRCNRAFAVLVKKGFNEILGTPIGGFLADFDTSVEELNPQGVECYHWDSDRWFSVKFSENAYNNGAGIIVCHDISEMKRISLELQESHRQLERSRAELEQAFDDLKSTEAQMVQREKMASLGQLAAGMAHEINNPMGFIASNLLSLSRYAQKIVDYLLEERTLLGRDALGGETAAALEHLRKRMKIDYVLKDIVDLVEESLEGADRVKKIVQDLKSYSRKDGEERQAADLIQCLESTINVVWNEIKYKATVEKDYGEIPMTLCHPQALNQVFMNLLVNAAQAIEVQGTIRIRTWYEDENIFVSIADSGQGILPENQSRLFEPFFTTKEVGKGTGLGLSVSYDIVKKHDGEIRICSTPGQGSTFTVVIPVVREESHGA